MNEFWRLLAWPCSCHECSELSEEQLHEWQLPANDVLHDVNAGKPV